MTSIKPDAVSGLRAAAADIVDPRVDVPDVLPATRRSVAEPSPPSTVLNSSVPPLPA